MSRSVLTLSYFEMMPEAGLDNRTHGSGGPLRRDTHYFRSPVFLSEGSLTQDWGPLEFRQSSPDLDGARVGSNPGGATTDTDTRSKLRSDRAACASNVVSPPKLLTSLPE